MKMHEIIKKRRLEKSLTQEQVAQQLGVSTPAVNKWEKGTSFPDITLLPPTCKTFRYRFEYLIVISRKFKLTRSLPIYESSI